MSRHGEAVVRFLREEWGDLPRDARKGIDRYITFNEFTPKEVGEMTIDVPVDVLRVGEASWVSYRSDKWSDGWHNYIHDHDPGVHCTLHGDRAFQRSGYSGKWRTPPAFVRNADTLTLLGGCIGHGWVTSNGVEDEKTYRRKDNAELYCTPNGKALLVIVNKRRLDAVIWGGKLDVQNRGIVG